jgi:hypothetical protein
MSYERTCGECVWKLPAGGPCYGSLICDHFSQRPATADELRAELLERAEALDGVALSICRIHGVTPPDLRWRVVGRYTRGSGYRAALRPVPCIHRDGDEGIE